MRDLNEDRSIELSSRVEENITATITITGYYLIASQLSKNFSTGTPYYPI